MNFKALLLFVLLPALLVAGCGKTGKSVKKNIAIGVSVPASTHGWAGGVVWFANQTKKALEAANPDVEFIITAGVDTADQVNRIENTLARKVDALVVMSQEPGPVTSVCESAKKQGVFLVVVSNRLTKEIQDIFVNGDNRSFGSAAARAVGKYLAGKGDILVMEGIPCPVNTDRVGAFRATLRKEYPAIRILDSQPANWNTEKGLALMENFLQKHKKIDAVWAGDDDVLEGALKAYSESGRKDISLFLGGGGAKKVVKRILDSDPLVKATVSYSPAMISVGMEKALACVRNGKKTGTSRPEEIVIPSAIIEKQNASSYYFPNSVY